MSRPFIVVGDRTDHGGTVLEGSPADTIDGKPIARVGDKVHCPRSTCRGSQVIVEGDPGILIDGKPAAFHGAKTSCGGILISSQVDNQLGGEADSGSYGYQNARLNFETAVDLVDQALSSASAAFTPTLGPDGRPLQFASSTSGAESPVSNQKVETQFIEGLGKGVIIGPKAIVIHQTGGSTAEGALSTMRKNKIGTHYLIDKDGTVYQLAPLDQYTNHVGPNLKSKGLNEGTDPDARTIRGVQNLTKHEDQKQYPDRYPRSRESIGIEVVSAYLSNDAMEPATPEQSQSLKNLVHALQRDFKLTDEDVFYHSKISYKAGNEGKGLYESQ